METIRRVVTRPLDRRTTFFCLAILALNLVDAFATLRHAGFPAGQLRPPARTRHLRTHTSWGVLHPVVQHASLL